MSLTGIGTGGGPAGPIPPLSVSADASSAANTSKNTTGSSDTTGGPAASVELSTAAQHYAKLTPEEWAALRQERQDKHSTYVAALKAATTQKHADWAAKDTAQDAQEAVQQAHWAEIRAQRAAGK